MSATLSPQDSFVTDVTPQNFMAEVVERSREVPVLVDFWADWCGPCKSLSPILDRLAGEYRGRFRLAKINTDQFPDVAMQFGVRSLPTVMVMHDGQIVDGFMGAIPEGQIRELLEKHVGPPPEGADEGEGTGEPARPRHPWDAQFERGEYEAALAMIEEALAKDPSSDTLKYQKARAMLALRRYDEGLGVLDTVAETTKLEPTHGAWQTRFAFAREAEHAPDPADLQARIAASADDCEARYQLSALAVMRGDLEVAMEQLLEIVRRDRGYRDDAGRRRLVDVFAMAADDPELVRRYRQALSRELLN